jgi:hypothetical protein
VNAYVHRLIPPRSSFADDADDAERAMMAEPAAYWMRLMDDGHVIGFGPVDDPSGTCGALIAPGVVIRPAAG